MNNHPDKLVVKINKDLVSGNPISRASILDYLKIAPQVSPTPSVPGSTDQEKPETPISS